MDFTRRLIGVRRGFCFTGALVLIATGFAACAVDGKDGGMALMVLMGSMAPMALTGRIALTGQMKTMDYKVCMFCLDVSPGMSVDSGLFGDPGAPGADGIVWPDPSRPQSGMVALTGHSTESGWRKFGRA